MCSRCSVELRANSSLCSQCFMPCGEPCSRRRSLWCDTADERKQQTVELDSDAPYCDDGKLADYRDLIKARVLDKVSRNRHLSSCILCLLFNQSVAILQMCSSRNLRLEAHAVHPVYYFNVKLAPDVSLPEVSVKDYQGYVINFRGSVGSYKPTFYYNWRDMHGIIHRDSTGLVTLLGRGGKQ